LLAVAGDFAEVWADLRGIPVVELVDTLCFVQWQVLTLPIRLSLEQARVAGHVEEFAQKIDLAKPALLAYANMLPRPVDLAIDCQVALRLKNRARTRGRIEQRNIRAGQAD
jgi:hypothetical protein